jgi:hypothetical protein
MCSVQPVGRVRAAPFSRLAGDFSTTFRATLFDKSPVANSLVAPPLPYNVIEGRGCAATTRAAHRIRRNCQSRNWYLELALA